MKTASMRNAYGKTLVEIGQRNKDVVVLDCDLSEATKTSFFNNKFPERFFNMGITEQNMMSFAAGLASCGKIPFATTLAVFASMRACEQVRTSICIGNLNVKIGAPYGGLCTAENGPTHQCIADLSIMRSLPNITVLAPSDAVSCKACVFWAAKHRGPVYIRILRDDEPVLYSKVSEVDVLMGNRLKEGEDIAIFSNGFTSHMAVAAAEVLEVEGISVAVHDIFSIKPLSEEVITPLANKCGAVMTIEEHNIYGGLGSAIAEVIAQKCSVPMKIIGISDYFSDSGNYQSLLQCAGLTVENIVKEIRKLLDRKGVNNGNSYDS